MGEHVSRNNCSLLACVRCPRQARFQEGASRAAQKHFFRHLRSLGPCWNHSIKQKAGIGFLPAWCQDLATMDPGCLAVKFFNEKFLQLRKLNKTELDRFLATLSSCRLEVVFGDILTERIIENVLCKSFRVLSGAKTAGWCDTFLPGQQMCKFKTHGVLVVSETGETEEREGAALVNRFPCGDRLLTMDKVMLELGFPSVMPSESRMHKFQFQAVVDFCIPPARPLSKKGVETTKSTLSKWIGAPGPIPRWRKHA
jgi:hypothetical protein